MQDENVTPEVSEQMTEAAEAHEESAREQGSEAWGGEGNQPEGTGYAAPDTGAGDSGESEIPVGVDAIEPVEGAADDGDNAPVDLANLDTGDDGDGDEPAGEAEAVDVSAAVESTADDSAEAETETDAGTDEAGAAADETAEASAEPAGAAGDDDEDEPVGDPDKFSGGGDIAVAGAGEMSAAEEAGAVPTEFRTPPGIPSGLDPGTLADRDKRI